MLDPPEVSVVELSGSDLSEEVDGASPVVVVDSAAVVEVAFLSPSAPQATTEVTRATESAEATSLRRVMVRIVDMTAQYGTFRWCRPHLGGEPTQKHGIDKPSGKVGCLAGAGSPSRRVLSL